MKRYLVEAFRTWVVEEPWRITYRLEHHLPMENGREKVIGYEANSIDGVKDHLVLLKVTNVPIVSDIDMEEINQCAARLGAKLIVRKKDGAISIDHEYYQGKFVRRLDSDELNSLNVNALGLFPCDVEPPKVIIDFSELEKEVRSQAKT